MALPSQRVPDQPDAVGQQVVSTTALERLLGGLRDLRDGNFRRRLVVSGDGVSAEIAEVFNELAERNQTMAAELDRVAAAANEGQWPIEPARPVGEPDGGWAVGAAALNDLVHNVLGPAHELSRVLGAAAEGDLTRRLPRRAGDASLPGRLGDLTHVVNGLLDQLSALATEINRVTREISADGRLGGSVQIPPGLSGTWLELAESVNGMATDLTGQLRDISQVSKAVATGDLSRKITVEASGETLELKNTINTMVDQLSAFADEVTRVAREVASEGRLGGQADLPAAAGTWRSLVDAVNFMANNLTAQVRNIAQVATAVARGDLTQKIDVDARGEILQLKNTINTMVDQLSAFADEVTRVAREVGTEGKLGGQARVHGVAGTWKDLTDNVNIMADNLTSQVRSIATVATAVAGGDLSKKITVEAKGEVAALAETINGMVETLRAFADQVTLVAREVGTEGILGGQARVPNVAGTWKDLTDNVNFMARNLTSQVRNIAQVTTAVARGDLSKKIDVDARGEILELKTTINTMVDQLSAFASEVTRVAREVGTEGKLGGQAEVADVSGTWRRLTESVNRLAGNLTSQVRAIAAVATAVTEGDLTRQITIDASGELAELKDNINRMIGNLKETTRTNEEQDWLKTNLARMSGLMQGLHDLDALASLIMSELTPLVSAQYGAFFLSRTEDNRLVLEQTATYGAPGRGEEPLRFAAGESLVGQVAVDKRTILVSESPPDYIRIGSGLGSAGPVNVVVLPVLFEGEVLGVIELASLHEFTPLHLDLLERLKETIGVDVNTIVANSRTEALLGESQHLAQELQARSEQLQRQQAELQRSNTELEEKAALLASRNRDIELKNIEIEQARQELEDRAHELSQASTYKSDFLANMSHELRTPLNSALILAKLLADNLEGNLTPQQVDLARTIHSAGTDLLQLINDVLDLSKVEAGHMNLLPEDVELSDLTDHVESLYRPLTEDKGLEFAVVLAPSLPASLRTDRNRLEQILRNLLSNAVKFTDKGKVELRIRPAQATEVSTPALRTAAQRVAFAVRDTGIGIPSDKLSRIFEAFQQLDGTTARKYGGTGLGLSISRELSTLLGGELQVRSELGLGSTFTLYLPVDSPVWGGETPVLNGETAAGAARVVAAPDRRHIPISAESSFDVSAEGIDPPLRGSERTRQESIGREPIEQPDTPARPDSVRFNGEKVLVVDDDQRSVYAMTTLLEQHGLQVVYADSGVSGLQALQEHGDITVVLMDVMMPELDGNATIETIRQMPRYRDLTIIAITAKAMKGDRERSLAAGATDIITKPVDVNRLLDLLAVHLPAGFGREEG
ncbi:HAMP domain-containing protein [Saccharopolyspora taberi]|uniref:histidine kinase n=1 Tax=Saccharopolyspora taberi TaxID=60895 RepID=A0ABN3VDI7_9PSEU